ncbi:MAG TPA: Crp/Fnr family transcriptional regulator [Candidatus Gemmiger stercoripullorum]|nr:Crp/Fnr family transcriptional regulator [Candidatus Gemmiger stercoripullorum]
MDLRPYYPLLRETSLLRLMRDDELDLLMSCFAPRVRRYQKGELLLLAGYETRETGILLEGQILALKNTPDGASVAITQMGPGGLFGDVLSGSSQRSPVSIMAQTACLALYLPYDKIIQPCAQLHDSHLQLLKNLVQTISNKYFALDRRVELLICKSLRTRISLWLLEQAEQAGSDTFAVPLTRAGLAEYLNCDRSALSRELGRMQREGLIETFRGSFKILDKDRLRAQCQAA